MPHNNVNFFVSDNFHSASNVELSNLSFDSFSYNPIE